MSIRDINKELVITNLHTHEIRTIHDFFSFSAYTQECILNDFILPTLLNGENLNISVGYKN